MKEETDMTKQEKDNRVPLWERMNLDVYKRQVVSSFRKFKEVLIW